MARVFSPNFLESLKGWESRNRIMCHLPFSISSRMIQFCIVDSVQSLRAVELLEILLEIGPFLGYRQLLSCIRVCKLWNQAFTQFLYYECSSLLSSCHKYRSAFLRNVFAIRDLQIAFDGISDLDEQAVIIRECYRLERLSVDASPCNKEFYTRLIQGNRRLLRFSLCSCECELHESSDSPAVSIMEAISRFCPRLRELCVDVALRSASEVEFYRIFARDFMPKLTKLQWTLFRLGNQEKQPWLTEKMGIDGDEVFSVLLPSFPALRELTVYTVLSGHYPWAEEVKLFEYCPNLESISWTLDLASFSTNSDTPNGRVETFIRLFCEFLEVRWPRVHSIRLSQVGSDISNRFQDEQIARVLKSCQTSLRSFELSDGDSCRNVTWEALRQHFSTLQVLYLSASTTMVLTSLEMQEILASCPQLIEFEHESTIAASDIIKEFWPAVSSTDGSRNDLNLLSDARHLLAFRVRCSWSCRRLQVLKIDLLRDPEFVWVNAGVFAQLKLLKELRELCLSSENRDFRYGLDPRMFLNDPDTPLAPSFLGGYVNAEQIMSHPVGRQLLEIWPGLTVCYWHNEEYAQGLGK